MSNSLRFQLIFSAIFLVGVFVLWPGMRRLRAIDACLSSGNTWDYSANTCIAPFSPHPTVSDTATARVKPRIVPAH